MDKKLIEETLKKIIALDDQTEILKKRIDEDSKENERLFRKELREMEAKYMEEIRLKSREDYKSILEEANREKRQLIEASIDKCHGLEKRLEEREEELLKKVFLDLFNVEIG